MIWQHGTYQAWDNGSLTLHPYSSDGFLQVIDPCAAQTVLLTNYNE